MKPGVKPGKYPEYFIRIHIFFTPRLRPRLFPRPRPLREFTRTRPSSVASSPKISMSACTDVRDATHDPKDFLVRQNIDPVNMKGFGYIAQTN